MYAVGGVFHCHNVHTKFRRNPSNDFKLERRGHAHTDSVVFS